MNTTSEDRSRITARVAQPIVEKLQEAADLTGATLNQFLIQAALEKAERLIEHERMINVSREDAAVLMTLLTNPAKPNAALERAFERHKSKP